MIGLIDYGLGNIQAFANIYHRLGISTTIVKKPKDFSIVSRMILPGVGSFDWAMKKLQASGLREALDEQVLKEKKIVLGVCVGMQMMASSSQEGQMPGLGWIDAQVFKFDSFLSKTKIDLPHMGWNDVIPANSRTLFFGLDTPRFYFLHSYFIKTHEKKNILATSNYGINFTSAVHSGNIYGTQFHPEKSHTWGINLLKNFAECV